MMLLVHLLLHRSSFLSWVLFLADIGLIGWLTLNAYRDADTLDRYANLPHRSFRYCFRILTTVPDTNYLTSAKLPAELSTTSSHPPPATGIPLPNTHIVFRTPFLT